MPTQASNQVIRSIDDLCGLHQSIAVHLVYMHVSNIVDEALFIHLL